MAQRYEPIPVAQRFMRLLRQAVSTRDGTRIAGVTHHLPIEPPEGGVPVTYTVSLSPDERGTFLVTCRELPTLAIYARSEEDALAMTEEAIRELMAVRRSSPDFPY